MCMDEGIKVTAVPGAAACIMLSNTVSCFFVSSRHTLALRSPNDSYRIFSVFTRRLIAAEDTRNSVKLLNYFEIQTPMTSYHEHNKIEKGKRLVERLLQKAADSRLSAPLSAPCSAPYPSVDAPSASASALSCTCTSLQISQAAGTGDAL